MKKPVKRKFAVRDILKHLPEKSVQMIEYHKQSRQSNTMLTNKM